MVVSKEGKRRRKVAISQTGPGAATTGSSPSTSAAAERDLSPPEIPKRPKVHAQRKFAQGQGTTSSSAYLNSYSSAPPTPAKDAQGRPNAPGPGNGTATSVSAGSGTGTELVSQVTELLPNMRPNTEDFLTFLCFRGTSVLPPALDFFNKSSPASGGGSSTATGRAVPSATGSSPAAGGSGSRSNVTGSGRARKEESSATVSNTSTVSKAPATRASTGPDKSATSTAATVTAQAATAAPTTAYMPFAVRKRAEPPPDVRADRKRTQDKMQALRKKYHDQRVAKLRATAGGKQPSAATRGAGAMHTRSGASRDRESTAEEADDTEEERKDGTRKATRRKQNKNESKAAAEEDNGVDDDEENNDDDDDRKKEGGVASRRKSGLRSGTVPAAQANVKVASKKNAKGKLSEKEEAKKGDQSAPVKPGATEPRSKRSPRQEPAVDESPKGTATRAGSSASSGPKKSAKATTKDVEGKEKRTTRLSALRSPVPQSQKQQGKRSPEKDAAGPDPDNSSSDDDEPLSRTVPEKRSPVAGKTTRSGRSRKSDPTAGGERESGEMPDKKARRSESVLSRRSDVSSRRSELRDQNQNASGGSALSKNMRANSRGRKKNDSTTVSPRSIANEVNNDASASPPLASGGAGRKQAQSRKKRETTRSSPGLTGASPEPVERAKASTTTTSTTPVEGFGASRPSRKTKEAATLYMELIGRKLNHDDKSDDDDASSLDSLELPNVRKLQQMENELKANAGKTKQPGSVAAMGTPSKATVKSKQAVGEERKKRKSNAYETSSPLDGVKVADTGTKKQLEKSFSDSDEEPLASKFQRKKQQQQRKGKASGSGVGTSLKHSAEDKAEQSPGQQDEPSTPTGQRQKRGTTSVASPAGKHNGTTPTGSGPALKTPVKIVSRTNSSQNSPAIGIVAGGSTDPAGLRSPATDGHGSARLNRSGDNNTTLQSIMAEAGESPAKVTPALLNIPTPITAADVLKIPTSPPFARQNVKPSGELAVPGQQIPGAVKTGTAIASTGINAGPSSDIPFNRPPAKGDFIALDDTDFLKGFEQGQPSEQNTPSKPSNSLLGNLLPSKEESEKIFGIASVSLAQSSGPLDTKCTLGKCGSVHKPPLGPPVLTESLLGGHLSPRDRRKAKVNMTHEQIQKWIDESSWSPIEDDLKEDLEISSASMCRTPPPPGQAAWERLTDPGGPEAATNDVDAPSTPATVALVTSTPVSTPAATGVAGNGRSGVEENDPTAVQQVVGGLSTVQHHTVPVGGVKLSSTATDLPAAISLPIATTTTGVAVRTDLMENKGSKMGQRENTAAIATLVASAPGGAGMETIDANSATSAKGKREVKETRRTKADTSTLATAALVATQAKSQSPATTTTAIDRKPIYRSASGRTPVYKQQQQDLSVAKSQQAQQATLMSVASSQQNTLLQSTSSKMASTTPQGNKFGAFSPINETSVYSFDKEEDFMPVATPFRRQHGRRESCNSSARDEPTTTPSGITKREPSVTPFDVAGVGGSTVGGAAFPKPPQQLANSPATGSTGAKAAGQQQPAASMTLSPSETRKAVDIGSSTRRARAEPSMKTEPVGDENDADGQTFYIPLQGPSASAAGSKSSDQLIQGVAVKLGTEGPDGPNQRVIMHAKLVTKAEMGTNPTTLPDSMNVQELVKSLTAQAAAGSGGALSKDMGVLSKLVPIGTVQPRFKSQPESSPSLTGGAESRTEDRNSAEPAPRPGGLSRINSNSSLSSQRSKPTKATGKQQNRSDAVVVPSPQADNNTAFPRRDDPAQMVEAPVFRPTEKEFQDPLEYIERIAPIASRFGICRIIPPASFKPECRIADDMRFMAYNQYVHKMLHRWGPSAKEYAAIKKYLATQSINLQSPPVIGGMEVDLPRLYHTVQELGGLKEVIEKKRWARVSEDMCIPKAAHDRVSKLDDIYCKYLLPYDTLSPGERQKLFDEVEADWAKREAKARRNADKGVGSEVRTSGESDEDEEGDSNDDEEEDEDEFTMECIVKGRNMPLNQFFRIARNTMSLWFRNGEPTVPEIEAEYWRHVAVRDSHVCVHSGSIDSSAFGFGFPSPKVKGSSCAKHPWNLKVLTNNSGSILRSLGPVMGITIPTLHVGMLFSACCWYRDPHGLPWIEYLHTGANKIWYGVPDDQNANFRAALTVLVPTHCQNKTIWLPCDTAMVPPHMLTDRSVSLCRTEQQPGQFVVVFPRAYTSSLCTGYAVSESVYFATNAWLDTAKDDFRDIQESCEPTMFSVEQLLFAIANDQRSNHDTLMQAYPMIVDIYEKEKQTRQTLKNHGVTQSEKIESKKKTVSLEEFECDTCRANLYLSLVKVKVTADDDDEDDGDSANTVDEEERIYCLKHTVKYLADGRLQTKHCRLAYTYSLDDIEELLKKLQDRIANKKFTKSVVTGGSAGGGGGTGGVGGGGGTARGKSSMHFASTSSQSSSSYQAPSHSKFSGMATMLK
ncbi:platelet binding protein GspB [Anopheles bellator]|uniref:platelet binding protein GspB n=1 Tax=Anopheles bellator TaxID=139047 RepID=UPI0026470400|nr:platelet binding protein GspB [Anopheles bellator]